MGGEIYASNSSISSIISLMRFSFDDVFLTICNASGTPKTCFAATLISSLGIQKAVPRATRPRKMASESAFVS